MSSKEFGEWIAYDGIDPGDPSRSDLRAALIACTVANTVKAKGRPYEIKQFLLRFDLPGRKTMQEVKTKLLAWKAGLQVKGRGKKNGS